jgi:hypothetical protein
VLGISPATADRYWAYARAWLHQQIARTGGREDAGGKAKESEAFRPRISHGRA